MAHEEHAHTVRVTVEQVCEGTGCWDTVTMIYARLRIDDEGDLEVATERHESVSALSIVQVFTDIAKTLVADELGVDVNRIR